jgi:hypothetical protein
VGEADIATWQHGATRLVALQNRHVARVREALDGPSEGLVVSEFVDGVRWSEAARARSVFTLEAALRVLLDVISGLEALHGLCDEARRPLRLVHCGVTSDNVLPGLDGTARVLGTARLRGLAYGAGAHYLAPEVLLEDDAADSRADVYSVGALLWEALMERALFVETGASAIVTAVLSGRLPRADAPAHAPWAAPLVDVAARALSPDPNKRYVSAASMAIDLRRIAGAHLASSVRIAELVKGSFGERIALRREELERGEAGTRTVSGTASIAVPAMRAPVTEPPGSDSPTPVPPAPTATTRPPPPLAAASRLAVGAETLPAPLPVFSAPPLPVDLVPVDGPETSAVSTPPPDVEPKAWPSEPSERVVAIESPLVTDLTLEPAVAETRFEAPRSRTLLFVGAGLVVVAGIVLGLLLQAHSEPKVVDTSAAPSVRAAEPTTASAAQPLPEPAPQRVETAAAAAPAVAEPSAVVPAPNANPLPATTTPMPTASQSAPAQPPPAAPRPKPVVRYDPQGI